jgi:hypothetical protein
MRHWLDPSVTDERDALSCDPALDMYDPRHALPYEPAFLQRFRQAQQARHERIDRWVDERLRLVRSQAAPGSARDEAFLVHRTHADPRFLDLSLDPNDRPVGSVWGQGAVGARAVNYAASQMGRVTSLTAWLSQWSPRSRADGPSNLARTSVPALLCTYTADSSTFPSTRAAWLAAGGERIRNVDIAGGNHYLAGQPQCVEQVADAMSEFMFDA